MMCGDGACHAGPAGADAGEGEGGAAVLENDAEVGELFVQGKESGEEGGFGVKDGDGLVVGVGGR